MTRNQPPVAGAIKWERSLFQRVKQTKQKLDTVEKELMADEGGQQVGALQAAQADCCAGLHGCMISGQPPNFLLLCTVAGPCQVHRSGTLNARL